MNAGRALRNKRLRALLYRHSNGKCARCGCDLPPDWHADHIIPWSHSKRTNVHEMQALCPSCNLEKGASMPLQLRSHQNAFRTALREISESDLPFDILVDVVPGGGKSMLPGLLAERFPQYKIAWYVPRLSLQHQAATSGLEHFNVEMREVDGNELDPSRGTRGFIATHQSLMRDPEAHRHELMRHSYIIVVDEAHHAKVSRDGALDPLASALDSLPYVGRLLMTGTLDTSDHKFIYGLPYTEGDKGYEPDPSQFPGPVITYSRKDALQEQAIVPLRFHTYDGEVSWRHDDDEHTGQLSGVTIRDASKGLYTALRTGFAQQMFRDGLDHWKADQRGKLLVVVPPRAPGVRNPEYAQYVEQLKNEGVRVGLAVQDNEDAHSEIRAFRRGDLDALVTVAMAYEGLDVPSVTHLICLTNVRSAPWIEQMLARAWRPCNEIGKREAYAFVPNDPLMRRVVEQIRAEQSRIIPYLPESDASGTSNVDEHIVQALEGFVNSVAQDVLDGTISVDDVEESVLSALSGTGLQPDTPGFATAMQHLRHAIENARTDAQEQLTAREKEDRLRSQIVGLLRAGNQRRIRRLNIQNPKRADFKHYETLLIQRTNKPIPRMTYEELQRAWRIAQNLCA